MTSQIPPTSTRVLEAVAGSKGIDAMELPPLWATIDPDALDALYASRGADRSAPTAEFVYAGRRVVVNPDGTVDVGGDGAVDVGGDGAVDGSLDGTVDVGRDGAVDADGGSPAADRMRSSDGRRRSSGE